MKSTETKPIKNYRDLEVFNNSYEGMKLIFKQVLPCIPDEEKFDLKDQLRRSCKAIPRLIAEGYAKRHQVRGFQRYLDDALAESNETQVSIMQARDLYGDKFSVINLNEILETYDKISRQIYNLRESWKKFN